MYADNDWWDYLAHHGILGQKWGDRNGPPYPLGGGDYSVTETRKIRAARRGSPYSIYNKKHYDTVLKKGKTLATLSYNKDRTANTDMFFAAHTFFDKNQYNALFNRKMPEDIFDENGNKIGTNYYLKYRINNKLLNDTKVASEDSGAKAFIDLYQKNRDFYNFVTDKNRMQACFVDSRYKFKGYKEAKKVLDKLKEDPSKITDKDLSTIYRMFNYVLPNDGGGNRRVAKDVLTQRTKFFNELKKNGFGAVLDTNDALYGGFKAESPVIVFDMTSIIPDSIQRTTLIERRVSRAITVINKLL